ncbi:uncharacterized protein LY79DRAFT_360082 [Colletotrichum navitas]|uniref:Uncharacterized protein n=1 Tax=Colletotrichum navitas TaxID=681940 RepID=A0AAD8PR51_9PEZI|nr:uncharacterized protein LY79DRAFT_360082 [Colletotrichum navitas]KAK1574757.1 hypothetical protein LY79DRAFT_360082 [Colletotrichum navitas]
MVLQVNWLVLAVLSWTSLSQARPDNLRGRAPPVSNTCACLPVPDGTPSVSTKTEIIHETVYQSAFVTRQVITATVTMTQAPVVVTETVRATESYGEQVTVTCTEVISEGPDGSVTTLTKPPGGDWSSETKTSTSLGGSETKSPHHSDDSEATQANSGSATGTRTDSGADKPTHSSGGDNGDHGTESKPTSAHHCKHWDGTKCVKPTVAPDPTAVTSTAVVTTTVKGTTIESALPTYVDCSVSVALVTVYNTVTATVYQSGALPATSPVHLPRAPTAAAAR